MNNNDIRRPAVAGQFYPDDKQQLISMLEKYYAAADNKKQETLVRALIVPHAGYIYSGKVAAKAFASVPAYAKYDNIFLIGPCHHVYIDGASVCNQYKYYQTPLGNVPVNLQICNALINSSNVFCYQPRAHVYEHCIEVQLPFLQYKFEHVPSIVPILIGTQDEEKLQTIATHLKPYFTENNLFVISSDFSHYPCYKDALKADARSGEGVMSGNVNGFIQSLIDNENADYNNLVTSACGQSAIAVLLMLAQNKANCHMIHLAYKNSGDSEYGDKEQVVGYHAFALLQNKGFNLSESEKKLLLRIARNSIEQKYGMDSFNSKDLPSAVYTKCGVFVTLTENGRLRGCIGSFENNLPLVDLVKKMAVEAAFEDPRFLPLQQSELENIKIEISVLTPLQRIQSIDDFVLHRDGIFIKKGDRTGTFLPQVADETMWTKEEFLGHCSQDKAGIGWNGWKEAELYTYRALIFHEE